MASNCATLKRLLRGRITERVPRWSADTCPYWALRGVGGCAELERALKQRDALTATSVVVVPPGQVGGRVSQQPGAVLDREAAAKADARNPGLVRVFDEAGQAQRHPPGARGGGRRGHCYEVRRVADGPDAPWQRHASGAAAFSAMGYGKRPGDRGELLGSAPLKRGWEVRAVGPAHSARGAGE